MPSSARSSADSRNGSRVTQRTRGASRSALWRAARGHMAAHRSTTAAHQLKVRAPGASVRPRPFRDARAARIESAPGRNSQSCGLHRRGAVTSTKPPISASPSPVPGPWAVSVASAAANGRWACDAPRSQPRSQPCSQSPRIIASLGQSEMHAARIYLRRRQGLPSYLRSCVPAYPHHTVLRRCAPGRRQERRCGAHIRSLCAHSTAGGVPAFHSPSNSTPRSATPPGCS